METTDPPAYQLDPAQARRLVGILCLRPGERVLHLGRRGTVAARLASYLVGPVGEVVEADPGPAGSGPEATGRLPFPDCEFDAVLASQLAGDVPTELLAELGRVTKPTGRVAFALVPPASGEPEWVAALVERSGLRGTGVRFDPGTDPDAGPACLVTAFPPRPASGHGVAAHAPSRRLGAWALRVGRSVRVPGGRVRIVVAATAATVLAVGAGIVWGLAGAADERPSGAADAGSRVGLPGGSPGAGLDPLGSLDPLGGGGNSTGGGSSSGGGLPGGAGSGLGSGDGARPAGNRSPVIEDPGLSSDGMTLTIAPTVTDPDGDVVEVGYDDGDGLVLVSEQPTRTYPVRDSADGYRYPVEVTIYAADAHGAVTQQTVSHQLAAVSTVAVRRIDLQLESAQSCFASTPAERLTADLHLRGAVALDRDPSVELRPDKTTATLLPEPVEQEVIGKRPRQDVYLSARLAGRVESLSLPDIEPPVRPRRMFLDSRCQARVSVAVQITTR